MISIGRSLIAYPIFRLTLFMAAGIFISDTYLVHVASGSFAPLLWLLSAVAVIILGCTRHRFRSVAYGLMLSLSAFLLGVTLLLCHHARVCYSWPASQQAWQATVLTSPQASNRTVSLEVNIDSVYPRHSSSYAAAPVGRKVILYLQSDSCLQSLCPGQILRFTSTVSVPHDSVSGSGFHYARYLLHQGISGTAYVHRDAWQLIDTPSRPSLKHQALSLRSQLSHWFGRLPFAPSELAVLTALTIGDKSSLTPHIRSVYTAAGVSHILALSGMHVGILALILLTVLSPLVRIPHGPVLRSLLVVVLLWAFAFISGLSSSVVRAVSMFTLYTLAVLITGERYHSYNALTLTAFLMLLYRPFYLFEVGFQLSFTAVFSILLFYPSLYGLLKLRNPAVRYVWSVLCLSFSAQLGTLPLVLYHFGAFPTYFLAANLIVAPLAFLILLVALFVLLLSSVPLLGHCLVWLLHFFLLQLNRSMSWIHGLYGAQFTSLHISSLQLFLSFLFLFSIYVYIQAHSARRLQFLLVSLILLLLCGLFR